MADDSAPTFFIDRCLGKRSVPGALRDAGAIVVCHDDLFPQDAYDVVWIPEVARRGYVALTADGSIGKNPAEVEAVRLAGLRMFCLSRADISGREQGALFVGAYESMVRISSAHPGPFIYKLYRGGTLRRTDNYESD